MAWIHIKDRITYGWWVFINELRMLPRKLWPPQYRPMLDFMLDLGFLRIRTELMRKSDYNMMFEYIALELMVLRWGIRFRLYETMQRRMQRRMDR